MSSIASNVELLVAGLDLKLVQLLRQAMHNADVGAAASAGGGSAAPVDRFEPRLTHHRDAVFEPRVHVHPAPHFEPRPVIHPAARFEPVAAPVEPEKPRITPSPIQPPWKVALWKNPLPQTPKIKVVLRPPDICCKGSLLDCFL